MSSSNGKPSLVLLYHRMGFPRFRSIVGGQYVHPAVFRWQLNSLLGWGYRPATLAELVDDPDAATGRFAVTFDDGFVSMEAMACPILKELGIPATLYMVVDGLGGTNTWNQAEGDIAEPMMSADGVRALAAQGFEIGSHTRTHPRLTQCSDDQLRAEIIDSRKMLEELLQAPVPSFAYPYGDWDARVRAVVEEAGYHNATSTIRQPVTPGMDRFTIPRINMRWSTVGPVLARKIARASRGIERP